MKYNNPETQNKIAVSKHAKSPDIEPHIDYGEEPESLRPVVKTQPVIVITDPKMGFGNASASKILVRGVTAVVVVGICVALIVGAIMWVAT